MPFELKSLVAHRSFPRTLGLVKVVMVMVDVLVVVVVVVFMVVVRAGHFLTKVKKSTLVI